MMQKGGTTTKPIVVASIILAGLAPLASAQWEVVDSSRLGRGQGAIVVRDGAPGYEDKSSTEVEHTFRRGDAVVGIHRVAMLVCIYELYEENGRVQVGYLDKGKFKMVWMDPADLSSFTYDCGCAEECVPLSPSLGRTQWNPCFQEGRDNKLEKLRALWGK
jgi:hypothetical protein